MPRRSSFLSIAGALAAALGALPTRTAAQTHQVTLEASVIRGALGYAWRTSERVHVGVEAGFGFPQIDRTLIPEEDASGDPDFEEYLHVALLTRLAASDRLELDAGVRASIVDLWSCGASDCLPVGFLGVYAQPMVGWRRVKFGVRLTGGWVAETEAGREDGWTGIVSLNPFIVRFMLDW